MQGCLSTNNNNDMSSLIKKNFLIWFSKEYFLVGKINMAFMLLLMKKLGITEIKWLVQVERLRSGWSRRNEVHCSFRYKTLYSLSPLSDHLLSLECLTRFFIPPFQRTRLYKGHWGTPFCFINGQFFSSYFTWPLATLLPQKIFKKFWIDNTYTFVFFLILPTS